MARRSNNLAKTFIRSAVRQLGRDAGKVVSNRAFGDSHSTPIRMVRNADTSPIKSDSGRSKYRHSLDKAVNKGLPSTKASAKKALVTLENAFEEFISENNQITNEAQLQYLFAWIEKTEDFIGDVIRIVDVEEVKTIASEVLSGILDQKNQLFASLEAMEAPKKLDLTVKRRIAWLVLFTPYIALFFIDMKPESEPSNWVVLWGIALFVTPFVSYSMFKKIRAAKRNYKTTTEMTKAMKGFSSASSS
jgi:hypothetical protein